MIKDGYSNVGISYLIGLTKDGEISSIIDWQNESEITDKKGKKKTVYTPKQIILPKRSEKTSIFANIVEHRPLYIFGLEYNKGNFTIGDSNSKAQKSHSAFVEQTVEFLEGLDSPIINAYRAFAQNWIPENETENGLLKNIQKYGTTYFAFCLDGNPDILLHEDKQILEKWDKCYQDNKAVDKNAVVAQCAISGEFEPIAELHNKVKGMNAMGTVFVGHKTTAGCSYGHTKAYNSNISVSAMEKYTEAFSYLLTNRKHHSIIDDMYVIYWADGGKKNEICSDIFSMVLFDKQDEKLDAEKTNNMLNTVIKGVKEGKAVNALVTDPNFENINPDLDFYIVGIKPNSSRAAVKFIYKCKFGKMLMNFAQHQLDMQIGNKFMSVSIRGLRRELTSPMTSNEAVNTSLISSIFTSIVNGTPYPEYLLATAVRRLKTDVSTGAGGKFKPNDRIRTGIIKAYLNRKNRLSGKREEIKLSLDLNNKNQAYLCGRLFAVLEKIQQEASNNSLNRTIKDAYFASGSSKPALVFPKLLRLSQNHLKKITINERSSNSKYKNSIRYSKLVQEIINELNGEFPGTLLLDDQGRFMIGYYQQYQSFFEKKDAETTITEITNLQEEE